MRIFDTNLLILAQNRVLFVENADILFQSRVRILLQYLLK